MNLRSRIVRTLAVFRTSRNSTSTVKYMFPAVLGAAALLSALVLNSTNSSFISLETNVQAVEVGALFEVEVLANAHTPVNAVDITIDFPSDKLEVFSVDRGQSVLTIWTEDPVVKKSSVTLSGGTFRKGFIGEHELVTINFRALKTGTYDVRVSQATLIAGDGAGTNVPVAAPPASTLALFNYDDGTSAEDIKIAINRGMVTDVNNDGKVTLQDISAFMGAWSSRTQMFDFNQDGQMTFKDFSIILADFFLQ